MQPDSNMRDTPAVPKKLVVGAFKALLVPSPAMVSVALPAINACWVQFWSTGLGSGSTVVLQMVLCLHGFTYAPPATAYCNQRERLQRLQQELDQRR